LTRPLLHLAIAASLMSATAAHAALFTETFENYSTTASFESFAGSLAPIGGGSVTWFIDGNVDVVSVAASGIGDTAAQGNYVLDLNGTGAGAGSITTYLGNLIAGQQYRVDFQYGANLAGDPQATRSFDVTVGGAGLQSYSNPSTTLIDGTYVFTAAGSVAALRFAGNGSSNFGAALDNINVAAIPEPHEWAMMLAGLGLVGWAARRRRAEPSGAMSSGVTA
jgi:hypothetical protein